MPLLAVMKCNIVEDLETSPMEGVHEGPVDLRSRNEAVVDEISPGMSKLRFWGVIPSNTVHATTQTPIHH